MLVCTFDKRIVLGNSENSILEAPLCFFSGRLPTPLGPLLVIVCGGSSVDMQQLTNLKNKLC